MKYILLLTLILASCSAATTGSPSELRQQAAQIENATAQAATYAQAAELERQQSTRGAATVAAMQITIEAANVALAMQRDAATATAVSARRESVATMEAAQAQATATAVAKVTDDAQNELLFLQGLEYDRQRLQQEIVRGYAWAAVQILAVTAVVGAIMLMILTIARRPQNDQAAPQSVQIHGLTLIQDTSRQSPFERLVAPNSAPWVRVGPARPVVKNAPLMLPAPAITLPVLPTGHVLIAGETGSGKSTAMKAVLASRENVTVLDPHAAPSEWSGAHVLGGGRNFDAINEHMNYMRRVLSERYAARNNGQRSFDAITVATDEMPAIVSALGRGIGDAWREWLREGRKVGLFFVVSTQSTRVKTLGIRGEGDLLENFAAVLELGKVAQGNHRDLTARQDRPAVLTTINGVQPVVIPYHDHDHEQQHQSLYTAPPALFDDPTVTGLETAKGNITAEQFRIASRLLRQKTQTGRPSGNAIQSVVWGYSGGNAYYYLEQIKREIEINTEGT